MLKHYQWISCIAISCVVWWAARQVGSSTAWRAATSSARYNAPLSGEAACATPPRTARSSGGTGGWRRVTGEPGYHFFGYFDKSPRSADGRYLLAHRAHFHGRRVFPGDAVAIGVLDTHAVPARWHFLSTTSAWNWQQGAMLQWLGGSDDRHVVFNVRREGAGGGKHHFGALVMDWRERRVVRELPHAVYSLSRDGHWAVCIDPAWLHSHTEDEGYGYAPASLSGERSDAEEEEETEDVDGSARGLRLMELSTGRSRLLLPMAVLRRHAPWSRASGARAEAAARYRTGMHFMNHAQWSTDGRRVGLLHRWIRSPSRQSKFETRFVVVDVWPSTVDERGETTLESAAARLWAFDTGERGASHFQWRHPMRAPCSGRDATELSDRAAGALILY